MKELGFLIAPNGEEFRFGEYRIYAERDKLNPHHSHNSAFQEEVLKSEKWKKLNFPLANDFEIVHKLPYLASNGMIVGLNQTQGTFSMGAPTLLLVAPEKITEEQKAILLEQKENLIKFDLGLSYIKIIDKEENSVKQYDYMEDYFEQEISIKGKIH